ncbi:hypothetical protein Plhal304r1_c020g0072761 [Plasmopara halstedii]
MQPTEPTTELSQKYYDLIEQLPWRWFNDCDIWMKSVYALYSSHCFNTWKKLLHDISDHYNEAEISHATIHIWHHQ